MSLFYVVPILLLSARFGNLAGIATALACSVLWYVLNPMLTGSAGQTPYAAAWNTFIRFGFFLIAIAFTRFFLSYQEEHALSQMKSDIFSIANHDLNNSITVLSLAVMTLRESEPAGSGEIRKKAYDMLERNMARIKDTTDRILDAARLEAGLAGMKTERTLMRPLVQDVVESLAPLKDQKKIHLNLQFPEQRVPVMVDQKAMRSVMFNLISNAIKYTPQGGRVTVGMALTADNHAEFSVEDTGVGIKPEDREAILAGFYRTETSRGMATGHGIGLKLSNDMIAQHGGRLEIESEVGKGSRFHFTLPLCDGPDSSPIAAM